MMDSARQETPLYPFLLGRAYDALPEIVQRMHRVSPKVEASGFGTVTHGTNLVARLLARLLRFPAPGVDRPLIVTFAAADGGERLSRRYPDRTLTTLQAAAGPAGSGLLHEAFGPVSLLIRLEASSEGLAFHLQDACWLGLSLSRLLRPSLDAREFVEEGWYRFAVLVALPFVGQLIRYEGRLRPL